MCLWRMFTQSSGDGIVRKVLASQAQGSKVNPRTHVNKQTTQIWWNTLEIRELGRWRQVHPWDTPANPTWIHKFKPVSLSQEGMKTASLGMAPNDQWCVYTHTYTQTQYSTHTIILVHMQTYMHTHVHTCIHKGTHRECLFCLCWPNVF